jgi:hypothetical protein
MVLLYLFRTDTYSEVGLGLVHLSKFIHSSQTFREAVDRVDKGNDFGTFKQCWIGFGAE